MGSTGATGSKARSGGASVSPASVSSVKVQTGKTVQLEKPLQYGLKDNNIPDPARAVIEPWEQSQAQAKVESVLFTDDAGNVISKARGNKTSVTINLTRAQELAVTTMTHNHPRTNDLLGGPLSQADLKAFTDRSTPNLRTLRATAAEGTYSISKGANFKGKLFRKNVIGELDKVESNYDRVVHRAYKEFLSSKITWSQFKAKEQSSFNGFLVRIHNVLLDNQSKYDYTYTLEPK